MKTQLPEERKEGTSVVGLDWKKGGYLEERERERGLSGNVIISHRQWRIIFCSHK